MLTCIIYDKKSNNSIGLFSKRMLVKLITKGVLSLVPGINKLSLRHTGGTVSARYCYSVWLRHLVLAHEHGMLSCPEVMAELGPGDSIGTGLAAILSGANEYYALDVRKYAEDIDRNIAIFNELVLLFKNREKIPNEQEFPELKPLLSSYEFPKHILSDEQLNGTLSDDRIKAIKNVLSGESQNNNSAIQILYCVPWHKSAKIMDGSIDMIYSQAVLEHVNDLGATYETLYRWLKPGGVMSHEIDFKCHGTAKEWNGHWAYSDFLWKIIRGRRMYFINREPHSTHITLMEKSGFAIVLDKLLENQSGIKKGQRLSERFRELCDADLKTSEAFIIASKR